MADTGWVIAGTGANQTGVGTSAWTNVANVTADDATNAIMNPVAGKNVQSNYLEGSNFGLSVPTGATINGIEIRGQFLDTTAIGALTHALVYHPTSGNGTDQEAGSTALTATPTDYTYGSASQLHGLSWTAADVNNSSFGVRFSCNTLASGVNWGIPECDAIWVKVHYTLSAGGRSYAFWMT